MGDTHPTPPGKTLCPPSLIPLFPSFPRLLLYFCALFSPSGSVSFFRPFFDRVRSARARSQIVLSLPFFLHNPILKHSFRTFPAFRNVRVSTLPLLFFFFYLLVTQGMFTIQKGERYRCPYTGPSRCRHFVSNFSTPGPGRLTSHFPPPEKSFIIGCFLFFRLFQPRKIGHPPPPPPRLSPLPALSSLKRMKRAVICAFPHSLLFLPLSWSFRLALLH